MVHGADAIARLVPQPKRLCRTREGGWRAKRLRVQGVDFFHSCKELHV